MTERPNKPLLDRVIVLSDSEERAPSDATSHPGRKHLLNSPQSTIAKRPRIQSQLTTNQSLHHTNSSAADKPAPGTPAPGTPAPGTPAPGIPAPGTPAPGIPAPGIPAPGIPAPGIPAPGIPAPGIPALHSHPQPANLSPPQKHQNPSVKADDISSPSARRRSPSMRSKHSEPHSGNNQPDSDEEDPPLDLAKISSYEYEQVAKLNPIQLRRYEQYRRSDLKNAKVRRLILAISPTSKPTEPYVIAVKGLAKLFVGDIVETALQVKKRLGDKGALQPRHIREAYRRLRREGAVPFNNQKDNMLE